MVLQVFLEDLNETTRNCNSKELITATMILLLPELSTTVYCKNVLVNMSFKG